MLVIYDLITRGADTSDDSWIDRFVGMSYDDLLDSYDMTPTDAERAAALDFEDDAKMIQQNWEDFRTLGLGISFVKKKRKLFWTGLFALLTLAAVYHGIYNMLQLEYKYVGALLPIATYIPLTVVQIRKSRKTQNAVKAG